MSKVNVFFIGNVGKDAEIKLVGDNKVARFNVAVSERITKRDGTKEDKTIWMQVEAWRGLAEFAEKHISKGMKLFVQGTLEVNSYEKDGQKKTFEYVLANNIEITNWNDDKQDKTGSDGAGFEAASNSQEDDLFAF